jgi:hypothetical protein
MESKQSIMHEPLSKLKKNYKKNINIINILVPRTFRLLDEMEKPGDAYCSYGLEKRKIKNKIYKN